MASPKVARDTPWLDKPLVFSGNYREYECMLNVTSQCDYQQGYWVFWYEADHRYALPTIAFFVATILVFSIVHVANYIIPRRIQKTPFFTKTRALFRYLSYRTIRIPFLDWNSASLGLLMLAGVGTIFFFAMTLGPKPYYWPNTEEVDYGSSPPIATRAGWMALACMPFVFATAGKASLITFCTGVPHERLQVFHRWISYAFFILSLIHTFPFIVYNIQMGMMTEMWNTSVFYWTGTVALVAQAWLTFASFNPFRTWCYEWFKFSHFVAALVFVLFLFFHCDATLTAWDYFVATGVLFALSWLYRQVRVYFEHGISHRAELTLTPNGFIRVAVPTSAKWIVGQHYFVRFIGLGMHAWTIHPFTACSLPMQASQDPSKKSELLFFIRPRGGMTARLARLVESRDSVTMRVLLDGPYGGVKINTIRSSQRQLVIAGGSGAGWTLPFIISFLRRFRKDGHGTNLSSQQSMRVILATREMATLEWFEDEVSRLLSSSSKEARLALEIDMYYTGSEVGSNPSRPEPTLKVQDEIEKAAAPLKSHADSSLHVGAPEDQESEMHLMRQSSRPNLPSVVEAEAAAAVKGQELGIFVCGPLSMQSDVSNASALEQFRLIKRGTGDISLHIEHFSWA